MYGDWVCLWHWSVMSFFAYLAFRELVLQCLQSPDSSIKEEAEGGANQEEFWQNGL